MALSNVLFEQKGLQTANAQGASTMRDNLVNLPTILDQIWKSTSPRKVAARAALEDLDGEAQFLILKTVDFIDGQLRRDAWEKAIQPRNMVLEQAASKNNILTERAVSILAALQLLRDHSDAAAFKPAAERRQWIATIGDEFELTEDELRRLLLASSVLEGKALIRHVNSN